MALFTALPRKAGYSTGDSLAAVLRTIAANFGLIEPSVTAHNAAGDYTLVAADKVVNCNNAAAQTVTVPPNASVAFPIGTRIEVIRNGAGQVTITPGAAVTLQKIAAKALTFAAVGGTVALRKVAANVWQVSGDLT